MSYAERAKKIYAEPDSSGLGAYRGIGEPEIAITALQESVSNIRKWYGRFPISWGEIHRMRHGGLDLPLAGADGERFGMLASLGGRPGDEDKHIYVTGGHSYIAVVAFTKPLQAWSIFPYGNNRQDPESEHYTDQTRLFADFQFKPAWFTKEDILKNVEKIYSPGE